MRLEEAVPKKQAELAEEFGLEEYATNRPLAKLELHHHITRRREGTDKIVSLREDNWDSASGDVLFLGVRSLSASWQPSWHCRGAPFHVFPPWNGLILSGFEPFQPGSAVM